MVTALEDGVLNPEQQDQILRLWNRTIGFSFPLDRRLFEQQLRLDKGKRAFFVDQEGGSIRAAVLVKEQSINSCCSRSSSPANISFLLVDPDLRHHGIGSALYAEAERWARGRQADSLRIGGDRYHFFPGCPSAGGNCPVPEHEARGFAEALAFFKARGFREEETPEDDLIIDLRSIDFSSLSAQPLQHDLLFRPYKAEFHDELFSFFARVFPGRWGTDISDSLEAGMRCRDICLLMRKTDQNIIGFSRIYDKDSPILGPSVFWRSLMGPNPGGLGPLGIAPEYRNKGIGIDFIRLSLQSLALRGVEHAVMDWTNLNGFYGKMGFEVWKRYTMLWKAIE